MSHSFALRLNRQLSSVIPAWGLAVFTIAAAMLVYTFPRIVRSDLGVPPRWGDGPDYDAIAYQLSKGNGFSVDWDDPGFRVPYREHNEAGQYDYLLERHGKGVTAYRPPLLPAVMALSYRVFGRNFLPVRLFTCLCMALTGGIAVAVLSSRFGILPGVICAGLFVAAPPLARYATAILTESIASLLVIVMTVLLLRAAAKPHWHTAAWLGLAAGIAFLARTVFVLWLPILALALWLPAARRGAGFSVSAAVTLPLVFLAVFLSVAAPWMLRNCLVLDGFEPLGTLGARNLAAAYSDRAFETGGRWYSLSQSGFFDPLDMEDAPLIERERMMAEYSRKAALRWVLKNPLKVAVLAAYKVRGLWKPDGARQTLLLMLAAAGVAVLVGTHARQFFALLAVLTACTLATAVTWSVGGRFLVPVAAILVMLAALGIWGVLLAGSRMATFGRQHGKP